MTRLLFVVAFVVAVAVSPARAQDQYQLLSYLDYPGALSFHSPKVPMIIFGWAFECRSGLQPATQRVGDIAVSFFNRETNTEFLPKLGSVKLVNIPRPDVLVAFGRHCSAMGPHVGYALIVSDLPPPGFWQIRVLVDTFDGRGRVLARIDRRDVYFYFGPPIPPLSLNRRP